MENIVIKGAHDVFFIPNVNFDYIECKCELGGESYLEETTKFYTPLLNWIDQYYEEIGSPLTFNFSLTYFNTSSSGAILNILNKLKANIKDGKTVTINWYYDADDLDMKEEIEDYIYSTDLPINLIAKG